MRLGVQILVATACLLPSFGPSSTARAEGVEPLCSFQQAALEARAVACTRGRSTEPAATCSREVPYGRVPFCLHPAPVPGEPAACSMEPRETAVQCSYAREAEMLGDAHTCSFTPTFRVPYLDRR